MAKKSTFWADFKKFITKGNVIDMAVGVVIGASFGAIVTGLVNYIINPFVGLFMPEGSLDTIKTVITPATLAEDGVTVLTEEVAILWGSWLKTIIDFLITAFCIFVVLRIIMKAKARLTAEKDAEEAAKAAEAQAAADKAAAEAKVAADEQAKLLAEKEERLAQSQLNQEKLLVEIKELLAKKG